MYIAMNLHNGEAKFGEVDAQFKLPEKCKGILFVFETKAAARKFWGKDVELCEIETK